MYISFIFIVCITWTKCKIRISFGVLSWLCMYEGEYENKCSGQYVNGPCKEKSGHKHDNGNSFADPFSQLSHPSVLAIRQLCKILRPLMIFTPLTTIMILSNKSGLSSLKLLGSHSYLEFMGGNI